MYGIKNYWHDFEFPDYDQRNHDYSRYDPDYDDEDFGVAHSGISPGLDGVTYHKPAVYAHQGQGQDTG